MKWGLSSSDRQVPSTSPSSHTPLLHSGLYIELANHSAIAASSHVVKQKRLSVYILDMFVCVKLGTVQCRLHRRYDHNLFDEGCGVLASRWDSWLEELLPMQVDWLSHIRAHVCKLEGYFHFDGFHVGWFHWSGLPHLLLQSQRIHSIMQENILFQKSAKLSVGDWLVSL